VKTDRLTAAEGHGQTCLGLGFPLRLEDVWRDRALRQGLTEFARMNALVVKRVTPR